jgi:hypothetical protein
VKNTSITVSGKLFMFYLRHSAGVKLAELDEDGAIANF